jgi:hypothetical protein
LNKLFGRFTSKKEVIPANLKFIFVTSENFLTIASLYVNSNLKIIKKYDCCILNTHKTIFNNNHFTNVDKDKIINNIASNSSLMVSKAKDFGIINFRTLLQNIADCSDITEFETKFKEGLVYAITGK